MAKDPAFLFYPGDYLRDTQTLSESTQVAYDRIMCEHMRNICISKRQLKFFTKRLDSDEIEELMDVLTEIETGKYQITWVAESIEKRRKYSESRRKNRKGKSSKTPNNISETYDDHMENENVIGNENNNDSFITEEQREKLINDLQSSSQWKISVVRSINHEIKKQVPFETLDKWIEIFVDHAISVNEADKNWKQIQAHFKNWFVKQLRMNPDDMASVSKLDAAQDDAAWIMQQLKNVNDG